MRPFNDVDLHAFVDQQGSPDRRAAIAAYLRTASVDAERVAAWREQNQALTEMFASTLAEPVPLWLTVGQIASAPDKPTAAAGPVRAKPVPHLVVSPTIANDAMTLPRRWLVGALGVAAGLAMPFVAARLPPMFGVAIKAWSIVGARDGFVARALDAHRTFATSPERPTDVADVPRGHLATWFDRSLAFRLRVPDLTAEGWTLKGSRLVSGEGGPAALLIYGRGADETLSLYAAQVPEHWAGSGAIAKGPGEFFSWSDEQVGYALQSTLPGSWLERHVQDIRALVRVSNRD